MAQGYEFVVDLGTDAVATEESMNLEGKVEGSTACRHGFDFAFRREDEDLRCKEVQFDGIEEVHGIGLRVVENLLDGAQPVVQFAFILRDFL